MPWHLDMNIQSSFYEADTQRGMKWEIYGSWPTNSSLPSLEREKKKSAEIWTSKSVTYQIEQLLKQTQTQD